MLLSFEIHVSFPLVRVCGILFHCTLPDVMPERKRIKNRGGKKKRKKTTEIKGKKKASKKKRREKETSLF